MPCGQQMESWREFWLLSIAKREGGKQLKKPVFPLSPS
jgi:hypothetical protein